MSNFLRTALRALERASDPGAPPAGIRALYPKADGWYEKDSAGIVRNLTAFRDVRAVVAGNVGTLSSFTVAGNDGVTLVAGDRVLLIGQSTPAQNGVYTVGTVAAGVAPLTRHGSFDTAQEVSTVGVVEVSEGTTYGGTAFFTTFKATDTLGTTAMAWSQAAVKSLATQFTTAQSATSYTTPPGAVSLKIRCLGSGGGGGSGQRGVTSTVRGGGSGGSGAAYAEVELGGVLPTTLFVTVGTAGTGGPSNTVNTTNGASGTSGTASAVATTSAAPGVANTVVLAAGGTSGVGGSTTASGQIPANVGMFVGGTGGNNSSGGGTGGIGGDGIAGGGGGGGGINGSNTPSNGGPAGSATACVVGAPAGTANPSPGNPGVNPAGGMLLPGTGGSGSGASATVASGAGGAGGRGGGGGGSAAVINGVASGVGGAGGVGFVEIIAHF